jgi:hypothetical protein
MGPGGIQVPAIPLGLVADVVADRTGGDLRRPRFGPVGEPDRAGQPVATVRPVGQIPQRGGQLQLQPALLRVDQDGAVAKRIPRVSIGGQKPAGRLPLLPPLRLGEPGRVQRLTGMEQPPPTADDADSTLRDTRLHTSQPRGEEVQTPLLLPALGSVGVAAHSPSPAADRSGQPRPQTPDRPPQTGTLVQQVPIGAQPLVLAGAGDRPRPAAGTGSRQCPLPASPVDITEAEAASLGQVVTGQPSEVFTDGAQHQLILRRGRQPRADADARWGRHHKRRGDRAKWARHRDDLLQE